MDKKANNEVKPAVDSDSQEQRILARRMRIEKRQGALKKRSQFGEDDNAENVVEKVSTLSQQQMDDSNIVLRKLHEEGFEMVTNIRVATDATEVARRMEEEEARRQRKEKLEAEAKAGAERFEEITKKWELAFRKEIPQDLHDMLIQQKTACDAMIDEKNKLIMEFQGELKAKDDQYVTDLKKQGEDIDLLIERMESQVKELTKSYQEELEQIEKAFIFERTEMLELQSRKWEEMLKERRLKEIDYMEIREKRVDDFEQQLQAMRIQDAEEYNQVKIKLETDVQVLQQQLQQMKATYQLNQEKLEYNFQVLRKRDEENSITKSQQKRKITKLHDVLTNLKQKLEKQEKAYKDDNQQLTADYRHQLDQFRDVQRKARTFMGADAKKFNEIWLMNEQEAKELARKVLSADQIIHEQQLGLPWSPKTDLNFMTNVGPVVSQKDVQRKDSAKKLAQKVMNNAVLNQTQSNLDHEFSSNSQEYQPQSKTDIGSETETSVHRNSSHLSPDLVKQILELLCDESGFLIESKLFTLLGPLQSCEQMLMKLDAIFTAMGFESEDDVQTLSRYFVKKTKRHLREEDRSSPASAADPMHSSSSADGHSSPSNHGSQVDTAETDAPPELISANDVIKALRTFVEENRKHRLIEKSQMTDQFTIVNANERDSSDDVEYWNRYRRVIGKETQKVWDGLLASFEKYHDVLTSRGRLIEETNALQQQNGELRLLLHHHISSKTNQDLHIPPTRIFQFNRIL